MKKTATKIIIQAVGLYLTIAFILWEIDPSTWTKEARFGFLFATATLGYYIVDYFLNREEK